MRVHDLYELLLTDVIETGTERIFGRIQLNMGSNMGKNMGDPGLNLIWNETNSFHIFNITNICYIYGFRHIFVTDICHISSWGCEISSVCHVWNFFDFRNIRFFQNGNFRRDLFRIKLSNSINFDLNVGIGGNQVTLHHRGSKSTFTKVTLGRDFKIRTPWRSVIRHPL